MAPFGLLVACPMFNIEMLYCEFVFRANKKLDCLLDSDVGDQQMFIALLTNFQYFVAVPFISTRG